MQVLGRRFPDANVKIYPAQVQGNTASLEVAQGIAFFNRTKSVDVIVITRGGGSMEDLFPFNSENLARVIAASKIPTISAIGHEIDFTICDFVADLRVPTPSAAAELVIRDQFELLEELNNYKVSLIKNLQLQYATLEKNLETMASAKLFKNIQLIYENYAQSLDEKQLRLNSSLNFHREKFKSDLKLLDMQLNNLNPQMQLARGYTIVTDEKGNIVKSSQQKSGTKLSLRFSDGDLKVKTE
jgi:exodeoxyribonuclease VII large subunit